VVWSSENGRNWTFHDSAPWPARCGHTAVVLRDTLWIFGGYGDNSQYLNDIWYLADTSGGIDEEKQIIAQIFTPTPTIIHHVSELTLTEPGILLDITGRKVATFRLGANNIRNLKPGIYSSSYLTLAQSYAKSFSSNEQKGRAKASPALSLHQKLLTYPFL
jgi:hypothetical protein